MSRGVKVTVCEKFKSALGQHKIRIHDLQSTAAAAKKMCDTQQLIP